MTLGWAVVGTGDHVRERMAPALVKAEDTTLAAVCSREISRAKEFAQRFGFARAYQSYEELLRDDTVDVVYLCTPNSLHAEQAVKAARAGKHVLVEKPMAMCTAEAEKMVEACEANNVRLGVGFNFRHHPAQQEARRTIADGTLGKPFFIEVKVAPALGLRDGWWQDPAMIGAYIMGARGCHALDLIFFLAGKGVEEVSMMTGDPHGSRVETALGMLRLGDNVLATFVASLHGDGSPYSYSVTATQGYLEAANTMGTVGPDRKPALRITSHSSTVEHEYGNWNAFKQEIEAFNRAAVSGERPNASGHDGLEVVRATDALLESAQTGRIVRVR